MNEGTSVLEERLAKLERGTRRSRRAAVAAAVLAGAFAVVAARAPAPAEEVRAKRIVLTDAAGAPRATLAVDPDGAAALRLLDAKGQERLAAVVTGETPSLSLTGQDGKSAAKLTVDSGVPRFALADAAGHDRLWVALRLGSPAIQFLTPDGAARSGFATMNGDSGVVVISGADGKTPGIALYDKDRKIVWSAP